MTTPTETEEPLTHQPFRAFLAKEGIHHPGLQPQHDNERRHNKKNRRGKGKHMDPHTQAAPRPAAPTHLSAQPPEVPHVGAEGIPVQLAPKPLKRVFIEAVIGGAVIIGLATISNIIVMRFAKKA